MKGIAAFHEIWGSKKRGTTVPAMLLDVTGTQGEMVEIEYRLFEMDLSYGWRLNQLLDVFGYCSL